MINCIIVDDEPLARQLIESYINQLSDLACLGSYSSAIEAFAALHQFQIDVIFIDIEMPGITGLNFIKSLKIAPKVVFITAYTEYAVDAFEINVIDYLVKPVTFERFLKAVQRVGLNENLPQLVQQQTLNLSYIFLKVDKRLVKIDLSSIVHIEGLGDYLKVHTTHQSYITYMTLGKLESLLPASIFIRIHRSIIVNTSFIQFIEGNIVKVNSTDLAIGQTYRENLIKKLN